MENIVLKSDDQLVLIVFNTLDLYLLRKDYRALFVALNAQYEYTNVQFMELVNYMETYKNDN